ncbi:hypothetical protein PR202_ga25029 [Eleusine coracana subsp. coracana]|uniref:Uncharacterized protein n=1 Tax=Eleusine coracana subsp. coracana TaxID=191504 RepID=A0AAV5D9Z8_ELECO|nr:hypothetical protein PR202_ga25029 [Eleusine coracana subsp. coracana]
MLRRADEEDGSKSRVRSKSSPSWAHRSSRIAASSRAKRAPCAATRTDGGGGAGEVGGVEGEDVRRLGGGLDDLGDLDLEGEVQVVVVAAAGRAGAGRRGSASSAAAGSFTEKPL